MWSAVSKGAIMAKRYSNDKMLSGKKNQAGSPDNVIMKSYSGLTYQSYSMDIDDINSIDSQMNKDAKVLKKATTKY